MENPIYKLPLGKDDNIVLGVSGGLDSMVLLDLCLSAQKTMQFIINVVHVNHNIRDKEAKRDENFVAQVCKRNNLNVLVYNVDCLGEQKRTGESLEEVARRLRYDCLYEAASKTNSKLLLLAHHKDDQAETILMNLFRGSGNLGIIGIKQQGKIARPLLNLTKTELREYVKQNNINFVEDSTNSDINYTRNFLRHKILPELDTIFNNVKDNICRFAELAAEDENYLQSKARLNEIVFADDQVIFKKELLTQARPLAIRVLQFGLKSKGWAVDISKTNYEQLLELAVHKNGAKINLPHSLTAYVEYDNIIVTNKIIKIKETKNVEFKLGEIFFNNAVIATKEVSSDEVDYLSDNKYLDLDKIPSDAIFRTRLDGDMFAKLGSGSKKFNDYLTNKKVPQNKRDSVIVLASKNKILFVLGDEISENVKIDSGTQRIVEISVNSKKS